MQRTTGQERQGASIKLVTLSVTQTVIVSAYSIMHSSGITLCVGACV